VLKFGGKGMVEKGFFIDEGGNNFRGRSRTASGRAGVRRCCSSAIATTAYTCCATAATEADGERP
jgi:hypothetical protein